jgi:23S rRNA pseudouridine2605 synthase
MYSGKPPAGDRPLKTLERVISKAGLGSRTEARKWIGTGRVSVNGSVVQSPDAWIDLELDSVTFDGKPLAREERVYLLLHKPAGYITTYRDPTRRPTVYDLLPDRERYLFPVGRLDLETSGLLILTNDADFAERLTNPEFHVPKTYRVTVCSPVGDEQLDALRSGVELSDGPTRPAVVRRISDTAFEMTITEGRNRQVRRMVEAIGSSVEELTRVAIGSVAIGSLAAGATRALTADEVRTLYDSKD